MWKAAVIGHLAQGKAYLDGQTVKTKILTQILCRTYGEDRILTIDTHGWSKRPVRFFSRVIGSAGRAKNVIILPAQNGLKVIVPLLSAANLLLYRRLHYVVIGGWLDSFLKNRPLLRRMLKGFHGIYVETAGMKAALEAMGFANVLVMPNCKDLAPLERQALIPAEAEPYRLCTFSRVMKEKGIGEAVRAVEAVNAGLGRSVYTLDIYGQVEPAQECWFYRLEETFPKEVRYAGEVPYDKSVEVLKNYFGLLFPTYYQGEGFAGTLIDALCAGVPVVASRWKYNEEIIAEGREGTLVPPRDAEALAQKLEQIQADPGSWNAMKENCLLRAREYAPERVVGILLDRLQ